VIALYQTPYEVRQHILRNELEWADEYGYGKWESVPQTGLWAWIERVVLRMPTECFTDWRGKRFWLTKPQRDKFVYIEYIWHRSFGDLRMYRLILQDRANLT
jgi:hypothetical protein